MSDSSGLISQVQEEGTPIDNQRRRNELAFEDGEEVPRRQRRTAFRGRLGTPFVFRPSRLQSESAIYSSSSNSNSNSGSGDQHWLPRAPQPPARTNLPRLMLPAFPEIPITGSEANDGASNIDGEISLLLFHSRPYSELVDSATAFSFVRLHADFASRSMEYLHARIREGLHMAVESTGYDHSTVRVWFQFRVLENGRIAGGFRTPINEQNWAQVIELAVRDGSASCIVIRPLESQTHTSWSHAMRMRDIARGLVDSSETPSEEDPERSLEGSEKAPEEAQEATEGHEEHSEEDIGGSEEEPDSL